MSVIHYFMGPFYVAGTVHGVLIKGDVLISGVSGSTVHLKSSPSPSCRWSTTIATAHTLFGPLL